MKNMTIENIIQATIYCQNGDVPFNNGNTRSFLFNNKWFPLRAVINRAAKIANEPNDLTTDKAMKVLVYLFPYARIRNVKFKKNELVPLSPEEIQEEIKILTDMINQLKN